PNPPRSYAYDGARPPAAPLLTPVNLGLSEIGTWMQQTQNILGLIERWHGMVAYRPRTANTERGLGLTDPMDAERSSHYHRTVTEKNKRTN
ncbi:MAG: hypothetical protein OES09_10855, partial [Gammaproteobacteria bacterium]|nr:hypothetical protein [Gammaproteobacteria bacterium]